MDRAVPMTWRGLVLVLPPWMLALADDEPAAYVALVHTRFFANLFAPRWGVLFDQETEPS